EAVEAALATPAGGFGGGSVRGAMVQLYTEGINVGYRGYEALGITPQYAFGHGLSYTTFDHRDLRVDGDELTVTVNVTNTGDMLGTDTVQVYAGPLPVPVNTAPKALAGFGQVTLAPGESRDVTISLDPESLSYWDVEADQWQIADGDVPL